MWNSEVILAIITIYILFCALVATIGIGRQIGFWLGFIITIFTTPIIGLIVISLSSKETVNVIVKKEQTENQSVSNELLKLHDLKEKGVITEEEFITQKEKILN